MGNMIGLNPSTSGGTCLQMSNGLTDVFLNVLVLSGSALAKTVSEKRLIVWLAERDQSRVGMGTVGFDLRDMPWAPASFARDREFLLCVAAGARERMGWEKLDYHPNEKLLFPCLDRFAELVGEMAFSEIKADALEEWLLGADVSDPVLCGFPLCPRHQTLLTVFGCHICNN